MRSLFWLLFGLTVGAIAAVLFTPQSGKKTRKKIRKQAKRMQLELEARTEKGWDRFEDWKVNAQELVEDAAKQVNGSQTNYMG